MMDRLNEARVRFIAENALADIAIQTNIHKGFSKYSINSLVDMTVRLFDDVMRQSVNKNKGILEQESLVQSILYELSSGSTIDQSFLSHSDYQHIEYFDNFMYEGASREVMNIFKKKGLDLNQLKGLKPGTDFDKAKFGDVYITQVIEKDGDSFIISYFKIEDKNGNIIFEFGGDKEVEDDEIDWSGEGGGIIDEKDEKIRRAKYGNSFNEYKEALKEKNGNFIKKDGTITNKTILETQDLFIGNEYIVNVYTIDDKQRITGRNSKGRFIRVPDYIKLQYEYMGD